MKCRMFVCLLLLGCQSKPVENTYELKPSVRHGWVMISGLKETQVAEVDQAAWERGRSLYQVHCQGCHGAQGEGDGPKAKKLSLKPADLTQRSKRGRRYQILMQINEGQGSEMPQWKHLLRPSETRDLSFYVQSLGRKK